jgi:hypothetical protein
MSRSAIAMCCAVVRYLGVKPDGTALTPSELLVYENKALDYINNMITTMDSRFDNSNYHYPSERLIQYSVAYDLLLGAGVSASGTRIQSLANTIYNNATYWLLGYQVDDVVLFANHKLIVAGALGTAACAMPENGGEWINYAMTKTNHVTFTVENNPLTFSGFSEGPHYLKYALEHLVYFFIGMRNFTGNISDYYTDPCGGEESGNIRTFYYDSRMDSIYSWAAKIRMPNGNLPPLDDTFINDAFCLGAPFAQRDPIILFQDGNGRKPYKCISFYVRCRCCSFACSWLRYDISARCRQSHLQNGQHKRRTLFPSLRRKCSGTDKYS